MVRHKSHKPDSSNITIRLEDKYISDLNLYAQAVGKNRSEILRSLVIDALDTIPEQIRQVMSVLSKSRNGEFITSVMPDMSTKNESFICDKSES